MDSGQDGNGSTGANFSGTGVSQGPIASNNATASGSNMIPMQPIASGGSDIVLSSDGQKSGKGLKWVIGVIVGVLILAGIGVGVWFGMRSEYTESVDGVSRVESYDLLRDFYQDNYRGVLEGYDLAIGFKPAIKMREGTIFPFFDLTVNDISQNFADIQSQYDIFFDTATEISEEEKNIMVEVKEDLERTLGIMKKNIDVIFDVYSIYIAPFAGEEMPDSCKMTDRMTVFMEGQYADVAQKYYELYCGVVTSINRQATEEEMEASLNPLAAESLEVLNSALEEVSPNVELIEELLERLSS